MTAVDHPLIERFIEALWLEKGLSAHTQSAYRSDLALLNGWLQAVSYTHLTLPTTPYV